MRPSTSRNQTKGSIFTRFRVRLADPRMGDVPDPPLFTGAMLRRGYSEERIRKFLGGNLLRVFRQITEKPR
jgi:microsomal dipeptidase-like Zn-dependent dipeptidase